MEIKMPAVFLCFDDIWIGEWHACRELFLQNNMKVTFYVTQFARLIDNDWAMLAELQDDGHNIGFHGLDHMRAGEAVNKLGCEGYLQSDIFPGLKAMETRGFRPQHFCYPRGNRTDSSDRCLLDIFRTLRAGGTKLYTATEVKTQRVFLALNFGKQGQQKYCGHEALLEKSITENKAVFFYMHRPVRHRLEYLSGLSERVNFYSMGALDKQ